MRETHSITTNHWSPYSIWNDQDHTVESDLREPLIHPTLFRAFPLVGSALTEFVKKASFLYLLSSQETWVRTVLTTLNYPWLCCLPETSTMKETPLDKCMAFNSIDSLVRGKSFNILAWIISINSWCSPFWYESFYG